MDKYNIDELEQLAKSSLSESRYKHTLGVAKLAKEIASFNDVDEEKAYVAGLLHDITKEKDEAWHDDMLRKHNDLVKLKAPCKIKHSYTAKYFAMDFLNINDPEILDAMYNHTICMSDAKLAKIIYIADKREENRKIDSGEGELAKRDLDKAYKLVFDDVTRYIKLKGNDK